MNDLLNVGRPTAIISFERASGELDRRWEYKYQGIRERRWTEAAEHTRQWHWYQGARKPSFSAEWDYR